MAFGFLPLFLVFRILSFSFILFSIEASLKKLGKCIKFERKNKNLSQEKLAELIGKTRNYIGMVERAKINVPNSVLFDIAKALNVNIKVFFDF